MDGLIKIRWYPSTIAAHRQSRGLAVVNTHTKKTQQQRPRWRAGTLQIQTVSSDYGVGAPPTPQLPVRTESPPSDEAQVTFTTTNGATNVPSGGTNGANGRDGNATNTRRSPW